jgi:hypothetical protein
MRSEIRFDMASAVLAMRKQLQVREPVVAFVSVLVVDVEAVRYWSVRLLPNFAMQSNQRRVVAVFVAMPDLSAPVDASVTNAFIPGRTDASGINPRRSIHTG